MTPVNWIVSAVAVASLGIAVYTGQQLNGLKKHIATVDTRVVSEVTMRTDEVTKLRSDMESQAAKLESLGAPEDVARHVIDVAGPDLVEAIATALTKDPEKAAALRGETGQAPEMASVMSGLIDDGLVVEVANSIWEHHYSELAVMPEVLGSVAEEVYRTYGDELKGMDGKSADPTAIAQALAAEPAFLSLLELNQH